MFVVEGLDRGQTQQAHHHAGEEGREEHCDLVPSGARPAASQRPGTGEDDLVSVVQRVTAELQGEAAAWVEGFLSGGGMLLVHDERLLALVDRWLTGVPAEAFTDVLPLLRRTFGQFESGVRRTLGELVRRGPAGDGGRAEPGAGAAEGLPGFGPGLEAARAEPALETVRLLLGGARAKTGAFGEDESGPVDERREVRI